MAEPRSKGSKAASKKAAKKKRHASAALTAGSKVKKAVSATTKATKKGQSATIGPATKRKPTPKAATVKQKAAAPKHKSVSMPAPTSKPMTAPTPKPTSTPTPKPTPTPGSASQEHAIGSRPTISRTEWRHEVELAAYRRAEQRHFAPGGEEDDWIEAEAEVNEHLLRKGIQVLD